MAQYALGGSVSWRSRFASIGIAALSLGLFGGPAVAEPLEMPAGTDATVDENGRAYYDGAPILPEFSGEVSKVDAAGLQAHDGVADPGDIEPFACGDSSIMVVHATVGWGNPQKGSCYVLGTKGSTVGYRWETYSAVGNPWACMQGSGYNSSKKMIWVDVGCGTSGSGTASWGEVAASKTMRGKAGGTAGTPAQVIWR